MASTAEKTQVYALWQAYKETFECLIDPQDNLLLTYQNMPDSS